MKTKLISTLSIILMMGSAPISGVSASTSNIDFKVLDITVGFHFGNALKGLQQVSVKKEVPYDESKDPALRKGTENWEEPQGSFIVIPAVVLGVLALFLFFSREK